MISVTTIPTPPNRPDDAHKGTFGTVIIVGGSPIMIGAPALAASGALRGGAGLVKIASSGQVVPLAITIEPGAMGIILADDPQVALADLDDSDPNRRAVLAVGPGLGRSASASALVQALLTQQRTIVLDADGLNALANSGRLLENAPPSMVMTPHPGEFRRLAAPLGINDDPTRTATRPAAAQQLAAAHQAVVVLKGHHSIVSDGDRVFVNHTGNPALATAGSGDVLTGLLAALLAQGMTPFDATVLATHLHGLAADIWQSRHGPSGLTAQDLAKLIPEAFAKCR